ncbi:hypothetical protein LCGC14_0195540 [marine sediment metagenome]|uniref:Uncharacterized protein n=1 Tax=marine sediment metagenome TaxID=412755 RepID=A0A0F9X4E8_9ZZZZ
MNEYPNLSLDTVADLIAPNPLRRKEAVIALVEDTFELYEHIFENDPDASVRMAILHKMRNKHEQQEFLVEVILSGVEHLVKRIAWGCLNPHGLTVMLTQAPTQNMKEYAAELLNKLRDKQIKAKDLDIDEKIQYLVDVVQDEDESEMI